MPITLDELQTIYSTALFDLIYLAASELRKHHNATRLQLCHLISIKTGGCPEDCRYCAQSSYYKTPVTPEPMMKLQEVLHKVENAIAQGATRICLGAAWREVREGPQFDRVLEMIKKISDKGVEVCCTLGMLTEVQAQRLAEAGLFAYNHNLDTSEEFYSTVISTRTYKDRLQTLDVVASAGLSTCCGGIIGMGESVEDRLKLLHTLANRNPKPESVPINLLVPIKGTPLGQQGEVCFWELLRIIATARVVLPQSMLRLAAGRERLSREQQALCFMAGANSIFYGEKLLTAKNMPPNIDMEMLQLFGLNGKAK